MVRSDAHRRPLVPFAVLVSVLMLVSACAGAASPSVGAPSATAPSEGSPAAGTTQLTIVPAGSSYISSGWMWLAQHLGYYEAEGLEVTIIPNFETAPEVALLEGQLDMIMGDPENLARRVQEDPNYPATCVATMQMWPFRVYVKADSPIRTAADLEGQLIGVPDVSDELTLDLMLSWAGVDPESVETIATGGRAPAALEMHEGRTDASMGTHVDQLAYEAEFGAENVRVIETMPSATTFNGCALMRKETVEEQPEIVDALLRALAKGATVHFEDPETSVKLIGQGFPEAYSDADDALALARTDVELNGAAYDARWDFPPEDWQAQIDRYAEIGFLEESVDISAQLDFSHVEDAWEFDAEAVLEEARAAAE